nr:immunoglobulin heavy chain junction region [Macaca mulatta]MOY21897.1 immunoglobulin heavy chain junction region [Macaca mulatta]MOY22191.1 immunoglobulin heavy chain junction region [Macaca mulatta]MOY22391.1 immunoglobulin heavy chain junction region [Macaca mulatta]MOY23001.1 immunoglobulin heavy chain junction region [Macaca mulatta]
CARHPRPAFADAMGIDFW